MNRFDGKTVLITGGARGQGASHARAFVAEGANVVLADVREERGRALADELGGSAAFVKLDVTVPDDWEVAVEETERRFGPISVLVNNAGIPAPAVAIADSDPADWAQVIATNLTRSLSRHPGGRAVAAPGRRRRDREHRVQFGPRRHTDAGVLCLQQVGSAWTDADRRHRTRPREYPRKRDQPWRD